MSRLNLNFLDNNLQNFYTDKCEEILHEYGKEISDYSKGYLSYIVTTTKYNGEIKEAALYILVPKIEFEYKIVSIEYKDSETVFVYFYTLQTRQIERRESNIKENWSGVYNLITGFLNSSIANDSFKFLITQIDLLDDRENN